MTSFANREASHDGCERLVSAELPGVQASLHADPLAMSGGAVRNDISTALVRVYREIFGRGPVKTATYAFDVGYVTFLRDLLAPPERVLVMGGRPDIVCQARVAIREAERERLIAEVRRVTGRPDVSDSFQFHPERNLAIELFWLPPGPDDGGGNPPAPPTSR